MIETEQRRALFLQTKFQIAKERMKSQELAKRKQLVEIQKLKDEKEQRKILIKQIRTPLKPKHMALIEDKDGRLKKAGD